MFGLVPQYLFDQERSLRIAAEQRANSAEIRAASAEAAELAWRQMAHRADDQNAALIESQKEQVKSQADQFALLVEHAIPLKAPAANLPETEAFAGMTYDEIMATPVTTRVDMMRRRRAAYAARERDMNDADRKAMEDRRSNIKTEEERLANSTDFIPELGVHVRKAEAVKEPTDATN